MKKMMACLSAALMLTVMALGAFSAAAAGTTLSVADVTANVGDTVDVKVSIAGNTGFAGASLQLTVNPDELEYVTTSQAELLAGSVITSPMIAMVNQNPANLGNNVVRVVIASSTNYTKDGTVITLKFKLKADVAKSAIKLESLDMSDENSAKLTIAAVNGGNVVKKVTTTTTTTVAPTPTTTTTVVATPTTTTKAGATPTATSPKTGEATGTAVSIALVAALAAAGAVILSKKSK